MRITSSGTTKTGKDVIELVDSIVEMDGLIKVVECDDILKLVQKYWKPWFSAELLEFPHQN